MITTDNPGCIETLENGKTGYIYHGENVDQLVDAIEYFLSLSNEERKSMGEAGRRRVHDNFSRDIVVDAYKEEIKRILS